MSQIAGAESSRIALDAAQARLMGKLMLGPTVLGDLWVDEGSRLERTG